MLKDASQQDGETKQKIGLLKTLTSPFFERMKDVKRKVQHVVSAFLSPRFFTKM